MGLLLKNTWCLSMKNLANDICISVNKCGCGMTLRKDKRANYTEGLDGGNMHELQRGKDAKLLVLLVLTLTSTFSFGW